MVAGAPFETPAVPPPQDEGGRFQTVSEGLRDHVPIILRFSN